jgi:hypothetical protein
MLAKRFFYVSAGILCLALAYRPGASTATAQMNSQPVAHFLAGENHLVMTANGDLFSGDGSLGWSGTTPNYMGNFCGYAPTPAAQKSWGQGKVEHR